MSDKLGLRNNARNPSSIANIQHHDASGGQRNLSGSAAQIEKVIAPSTTLTAIPDESILRVTNNSGAAAFVFIGRIDLAPGGVPDATNSMIIPANTTEQFLVGCTDDAAKSLAIKTSAATVQVLLMK